MQSITYLLKKGECLLDTTRSHQGGILLTGVPVRGTPWFIYFLVKVFRNSLLFSQGFQQHIALFGGDAALGNHA